jgi:hypothetical protein
MEEEEEEEYLKRWAGGPFLWQPTRLNPLLLGLRTFVQAFVGGFPIDLSYHMSR